MLYYREVRMKEYRRLKWVWSVPWALVCFIQPSLSLGSLSCCCSSSDFLILSRAGPFQALSFSMCQDSLHHNDEGHLYQIGVAWVRFRAILQIFTCIWVQQSGRELSHITSELLYMPLKGNITILSWFQSLIPAIFYGLTQVCALCISFYNFPLYISLSAEKQFTLSYFYLFPLYFRLSVSFFITPPILLPQILLRFVSSIQFISPPPHAAAVKACPDGTPNECGKSASTVTTGVYQMVS